ncbi:MAG: hypothetical protein QXW98_06070 [Candidatus Caldarchaeum sp.]
MDRQIPVFFTVSIGGGMCNNNSDNTQTGGVSRMTLNDVTVTVRNGRLNVIGNDYVVTYFLDEQGDVGTVRYALYRVGGNTCWLQRTGLVGFMNGNVSELVRHAVRSAE